MNFFVIYPISAFFVFANDSRKTGQVGRRVLIAKMLMLNNIAKILLNLDDQHISEAEIWINKAIKTNQQYNMRWNFAQDFALYAELVMETTRI